MLGILGKKYRKCLMPLVYFNKKILIWFWFVQLLLFFVLFCFVLFFPLLVCLIVFTTCSLFRLSWIYSAWLSWCTSTEGDVKQCFCHWNSCQLHLSACNCAIQAWCWGHCFFFSKGAEVLGYAHHANTSRSLSSDSFV